MTTYTAKDTDAIFPKVLRHIPQPPKQLYIASNNWEELLLKPKVAIVGSRKVTNYGKAVTQQFAETLSRAGVVIVSGLAYGVDAVAHRSALAGDGHTIAVLPTELHNVYPRQHRQLASEIIKQGGALITEYGQGSLPHKGRFVERNRIVSGIADILLVTEAAAKSGTLHTANFALDQGKEIFAVPGAITNMNSEGANRLIKTGAQPALSPHDILEALGLSTAMRAPAKSDNPNEQLLIDLLVEESRDSAELLALSMLPVQLFNQTVTMLEIKGIIKPLGSNQWALH